MRMKGDKKTDAGRLPIKTTQQIFTLLYNFLGSRLNSRTCALLLFPSTRSHRVWCASRTYIHTHERIGMEHVTKICTLKLCRLRVARYSKQQRSREVFVGIIKQTYTRAIQHTERQRSRNFAYNALCMMMI